jgi:hypothetical protein
VGRPSYSTGLSALVDLFLRKETHGLKRAEDRNLKLGNMVSNDQLLCSCAECAMRSHSEAKVIIRWGSRLSPSRRRLRRS